MVSGADQAAFQSAGLGVRPGLDTAVPADGNSVFFNMGDKGKPLQKSGRMDIYGAVVFQYNVVGGFFRATIPFSGYSGYNYPAGADSSYYPDIRQSIENRRLFDGPVSLLGIFCSCLEHLTLYIEQIVFLRYVSDPGLCLNRLLR